MSAPGILGPKDSPLGISGVSIRYRLD